MRAAAALVLVLAACAGDAGTKAAVAKPKAPRAAGPAVCPALTAFDEELTRVTKLASDEKVVTIACREARFGVPGWLVHVWLERGDESELHAVAFSTAWEILARNAPEPLDARARAAMAEERDTALVDLDGDGVDEVVELAATVHDGTWFQTLSVGRLHGRRIETIYDRDTGYDNSDSGQRRIMMCRSKLAIEQREVVLVTEGGDEGCPLTLGTHRFVLRGENIEEKPAAKQ